MISPAKKMTWIRGGLLVLVTLISVPASFSAYAAGLGRLSVNSSLGQPLSAEIELLSLQPGEFESLSARVASPDSFREARIDYASSLRLMRFSVDKRPSGQPILKITSIAPVNEPFLDVLVELNWPSGRLLREYPILLDPPGFNEARVAVPAVAAAAPAPAAPAAVPTPAEKPETTTSTPVTLAQPPEGAAEPSDTYGPVKKGDNLNKIATQVKSDSVSLEQMLVALYRENQSAFIDNNMNRLKTGQILRVPAAVDVAKLEQSEAQKEIKIQVANWNTYRESVAATTASAPARAESANQASGKIATAKPEKPAPSAESRDVLKLSKVEGAPGKTGAAGAKGGSAQDQVNALKEEAIARENALKEANLRVAELEKQIQDMRKLMQLQGAAIPAKPGAVPAAPAKTIEAPKPADTKLAQVAPAPAKPVEAPKPPDVAKPAEPPKADTAKPAEGPKTAEAAKPADQKPAAPKAAPKTAPAKPPAPEPDVMDTVMENLPYVGGGLALVLVGGGLFMFMRKRRSRDSGGPLTRASSILPSDLKPSTTTAKPAGGLIDTGNSSFLTDFDKAGPGTIDTDEVDPVAEAEVYIAYGRDAQAEEILKEAMGRDKNRHEITLKLLEIYHSRKSVSAFENLAKEFKQNVGETHPMWAKAAAMGAQIDPGNSLYAGFGQNFASTAAMPAAAVDATKSVAPPDLDFDLGFDAPKAPDMPSSAGGPPVSFDLDLEGPASSPAPTLNAPSATAGDGLDFDLGLDKPASPAPAAATAKPDEAGGFDFDLSDLSLDKPAAAPAAAARDKAPAFNLNEISLDLETAGAGGGDGASAVGTKLELAKAYVEIGDKDGAKEILQEVLKEGNAAQQDEAKSIIASL